jgi:hypothetical protein
VLKLADAALAAAYTLGLKRGHSILLGNITEFN